MKGTLLLIFLAIGLCSCAKIKSLPGYNGPELSMYSGYLTINENTGKSYFYWLVESQSSTPNTDPLIVWYQGGPGCSGLYGLMVESGPLRPDGNGGLQYNNIAWTNFANVLYLEQPTGVGFSYSNSSSDYKSNDTEAANDNFAFLELFLQEYPNYVGRNTWLTGESYAGVYIPTLTAVILNNPDSQIAQQLTGLTLGNPCIWCKSADYNSIQMDEFYFRTLVSHVVYQNWTYNGCRENSNSAICNDIMNTAQSQIGVIDQQKRQEEFQPSFDPDDLYQDFCTGNGTLEFASNQGYPNACNPVGDEQTAYLNRPDVQAAIGVYTKHIEWNGCSNIDYDAFIDSMIPLYESFFQNRPDLDILVYSGDVDIATVPFGLTQACLAELGEPPVEPWQPWFVNGATAGYVETYKHYTYATVKGGGHETPQYQPLTAYEMIQSFITTGTLNTQTPASFRSQRLTQGKILRNLMNRRQ